MLQVTLGAPVTGTDRPIGRLTAVVHDPAAGAVSHVVVSGDDVPGSERLVPIAMLAADDGGRLELSLSRHHFFDIVPFETCRWTGIADRPLLNDFLDDGAVTWAAHERIPARDAALRHTTRVVDVSGHRIGHVRGVTIDPTTHAITRLTLQKHHHVFEHTDVTVSADEIDVMGDDEVRLRAGRPAATAALEG